MANILVVDDAAFMCLTIKQMLERNDHVMVGTAANGKEAVERFVELRPDIVILDITMPEMNGIEALRRIKIIEPKAKVIICSALGQQEMIAKAIELGAQQFIVKPFEESRLIEAVDRLMS
ncbi:MAG: response regulator [Lachnospiraceae bacterium]|nr:response regulator [Lachnospiraceae bacterium]